jgi:hypothetical protein
LWLSLKPIRLHFLLFVVSNDRQCILVNFGAMFIYQELQICKKVSSISCQVNLNLPVFENPAVTCLAPQGRFFFWFYLRHYEKFLTIWNAYGLTLCPKTIKQKSPFLSTLWPRAKSRPGGQPLLVDRLRGSSLCSKCASASVASVVPVVHYWQFGHGHHPRLELTALRGESIGGIESTLARPETKFEHYLFLGQKERTSIVIVSQVCRGRFCYFNLSELRLSRDLVSNFDKLIKLILMLICSELTMHAWMRL